MKKDYENQISKDIKKALEPLDGITQPPESLSSENIAETLRAKAGEQEKARRKIITFKRVVAVAAAFAIMLGGGTLLKIYRALNTSYLSGDWDIAQNAEIASEDNELPSNVKKPGSYEEIERLFVKQLDLLGLSGFSDLWNGGLLAGSKASDSAVREGIEIGGEGSVNDYAALTKATASSEAEHGKTNTQVEGVDEADIVKNDGEYLYVAFEKYSDKYAYDDEGDYYYGAYVSAVKIVRAFPAESMETVSTIEMSGLPVQDALRDFKSEGRSVREMYLKDDMLYLIINESYYQSTKDEYVNKTLTTVAVYDVSDKDTPKFVKSFSQDGYYISSRLVAGRLVVMTNHGVDLYGSRENLAESCVPGVYENGDCKKLALDNILMIEDKASTNYLVVSSINLANLDESPAYKSVLGGGSDAYCTTDRLYVPNVVYDYSGTPEAYDGLFRFSVDVEVSWMSSYTEVFCFDIAGGITFQGSGRVPGTPLNQFAMDEYKGYFRIATTESTDEGPINNVFVMNDDFEIVGAVTGLAKGETIQSVRFMGDTGYVVTFERTDPLFVIDLSDPAKPEVVGELKIPGFSSYLHPVGDGLLLGVGVTGDENGTTGGVKFSLFDVSDPQNPKEIDKIEIMHAYIYDTSHKAFLSITEKNMYGVMIQQYSIDNYGYNEDRLGLSIFNVNDGKLELNRFFEGGNTDGKYEYWGGNRGTYIGDVIYVITASSITAYDMLTGEYLGAV